MLYLLFTASFIRRRLTTILEPLEGQGELLLLKMFLVALTVGLGLAFIERVKWDESWLLLSDMIALEEDQGAVFTAFML